MCDRVLFGESSMKKWKPPRRHSKCDFQNSGHAMQINVGNLMLVNMTMYTYRKECNNLSNEDRMSLKY